MNKKIQVDLSLFLDLAMYALLHADPGDLVYERIIIGVEHKVAAMKRHMAYTSYKTGKQRETRQKGRDTYLDLIGLFDDHIWPEELDCNVNRPTKDDEGP